MKIINLPEVKVMEASAGSGKTFALSKRYIQLIMEHTRFPEELSQILAITFTNKATAEMKRRIITYLKNLSFSQSTDGIKLDDFCHCGKNKSDIKKYAYRVVEYIIHHYDYFQIQTIDSFISLLLKGCAYRLLLPPEFKIEKDKDIYFNYVLDLSIEQALKDDTTKGVFDRFIQQYLYTEYKTSWYPKNDILGVMKKLFEKIMYEGKVFSKSGWSNKKLMREKKRILKQIQDLGNVLPNGVNKTFVKAIDKFLNDNTMNFDFSHIARKKLFHKEKIPMNKGYYLDLKVESLWDDIRRRLQQTAENEAKGILNCYIDIFDIFYQILKQYLYNENIMIIDEIEQQANKLIEDHSVDVPELYYRLSVRIKHYLIDEFQDTSKIQWDNLQPFIIESLSQRGTFFYVGDKKQAIYRFRGGDVSLFDSVKRKLMAYNIVEKQLEHNYRSRKEIVNFNNIIFSKDNIKNFINGLNKDDLYGVDNKVCEVFDKAHQKAVQANNGGYVQIDRIQYNNIEHKEDIIREKIINSINDASSRFLLQEIAILCRDNRQVESVSSWLIEEGFPVESDKTLNVKNNIYIK